MSGRRHPLDGLYANRPIFVLSTGTSLRDFDFARLNGRVTIGINRIVEHYHPSIVYFVDVSAHHKHAAPLAGYNGMIIAGAGAAPAETHDNVFEVAHNANTFELRGNAELSTFVGRSFAEGLYGGGGGCTALHTAILLGGDPIYLLGYDFYEENGRYFDEYDPASNAGEVYSLHMEGLEHLSRQPWMPHIFNCNRRSRLACFPYKNLDEALERNAPPDGPSPFLSRKTDQFSYFAQQLGNGDWRGRKVLDFGGNIGNILRDPRSTIEPSNYWCLDVVPEAVEAGRARWPEAHWQFYDRQCFFFNPAGKPHVAIPDLGTRFDYIIAYSVFTNTSRGDMVDLVGQLTAMLAPGGALAFSFIDPRHNSWPRRFHGDNFRWRLERERGEVTSPRAREILDRARSGSWSVLVNGDDLYVETDEIRDYPPDAQRTHHVFYTTDLMRELFPGAEIRMPVNDEMQHCCVIRKA